MTAERKFIVWTLGSMAAILGFLIGYGLADWWGWA